jgi:hypothetical protein
MLSEGAKWFIGKLTYTHPRGWGHICTELHVAAIGLRVGQEAVGVDNLPGGRRGTNGLGNTGRSWRTSRGSIVLLVCVERVIAGAARRPQPPQH